MVVKPPNLTMGIPILVNRRLYTELSPEKKLHTRPQHRKMIIYSFCTQNMSPSQEKWQSFHHKNVYYKIYCYIYWSLLIVSAHTIPYNYFIYQTNHYGHPLLLPQWVVRFVYPQFQLWPTLRGISCRYLTCKHKTYINNIYTCVIEPLKWTKPMGEQHKHSLQYNLYNM